MKMCRLHGVGRTGIRIASGVCLALVFTLLPGRAAGREFRRLPVKDGWTLVTSGVTINAGKPTTLEITMEPVTPAVERRGPPALSVTVPQLVIR